MVENIVGKGENADYKHFLFFPHLFIIIIVIIITFFFQKLSLLGLLKVGIVW